jgi:sugar O-acyltransferase (sialic acid O-acetyltransferase NeuD family)
MTSIATNNDQIILQGGGDHARVVLDCLLHQGKNVIGIFDPKFDGNLFGVPYLGQYNKSFAPDAKAVIAIGDNATRKKVAESTAHKFASVVDASALVSSFAIVGIGSMILHGAIIQAKTNIGNHVIINTGAQIDHDCIIDDYVHVAPGVILCGSVQIGEGAFIGAGATVIPGIKIGRWSVVGAGSVVIRDVPDNCVAVGNPARIIKNKNA